MTPALNMGSDDSCFKVSLIERGKATKTVSINQNFLEEKGEGNRTEVLPHTNLTPYR